jgi:hypothetical protein
MPAPTTKAFDTVEMSRQLREQTSRKLATLSREKRLALLNSHIRADSNAASAAALLLRENPPGYGGDAPE